MADRDFERHVVVPGQPTTMTLAELLELSGSEQVSEQIRADLEGLREAEVKAERVSAEVRLAERGPH